MDTELNALSFVELFGGVGLFLFGMSLMGSSLEKVAGSGLAGILEKMTTSKRRGVGTLKGWGLGFGVTAIIQSSAATTLMLIGFVNAGIMGLSQAIPVVFGSNIGSTMTAQILRLGDLGSGGVILSFLKPSAFAPMLVAVGATLHLFSKKQRTKDVAGILIGLGTLFYGMTMIEEVFEPLRYSETFQSFFTSFSNPLLGVLVGLVLTAIIQSSSASVGILQALSATGSVTYGIAIPIIIGQNIGKCMPIILGMIGSSKKAKRVSLSYLLFNIFGAIFFTILLCVMKYVFNAAFLDNAVNRGEIANVHLFFNLFTSILLLPLTGFVSKVTGKITRDTDEQPVDEEFRSLDDTLLNTPGIALNQCTRLMKKMGEKINTNLDTAAQLIFAYDDKKFAELVKNEEFIDKCETVISAYIVRIDRNRLTNDNRRVVSEILNSVGDFERIGDYAINIAYVAQSMAEQKVTFSEQGEKEVRTILSATRTTFSDTLEAFLKEDVSIAGRIEPMRDTIEILKRMIKSHHVERLQDGDCGVQGGTALYDLVNSFERIAGHSENIARYTVKRVLGDQGYDPMHGRIRDVDSEEYKALVNYYYSRYVQEIE